MGNDEAALARLDAICARLVERARPVTFRLVADAADFDAAARLRGHAVLDHGWLDEEQLIDGREVHADDARAAHLLAVQEGAVVGTARIVLPAEGHLMPMERMHDVRLPDGTVELGRVVVMHPRPREQRTVTAGLLGWAWLETRRRGYVRVAGSVTPSVIRLYRRMGISSSVVGKPVFSQGEERVPVVIEPQQLIETLASRYGYR